MSILDLINPIDIGSTATASTQKSTSSDLAKQSFDKLLTQAQCAQNSDSGASNNSLLGSVFDIGMLVAGNTPLGMGVGSIGVLQGLMNDGITSEFTSLGTDIASGVVGAFMGTNTPSCSTDNSSSEQSFSLLDSAKSLLNGELPELTSSQVGNSLSGLSNDAMASTDKLLFREGNIPWDVSQKDLLEVLEKIKNS